MKNAKTFFKDTLPDFLYEAGKVIRILFYEAVIIMVALGFLYLTNFEVKIEPKIISPVGGVQHE